MTTERPIRWQDKPVTRGNIVRAAGLSVVAFGLVAAAKGALNTAETHALRGPHWSAEWQIVPAKNALDIPWQKFKGHDEWLRLELGEPPYRFPWGQLESNFDSKGCASAIIVSYAE